MMLSKKKGFGLIELMISILVASIIVAGLYQLLTSSWLNFGVSTATARSGKSARQVDNMVNSLMFQAGFRNYRKFYKPNELVSFGSAFNENEYYVNDSGWTDKAFIFGGKEVNGNSSVKFRFTGASLEDDFDEPGDHTANGYIFDCRGRSVPNTVELEMLLFVNNLGLVCAQSAIQAPDPDEWDISPNNPVVIDSSIVAMRVLYGTTLYGNGDVFYTSAAVDAGGHWPYINLVKYFFVTSQSTGQRMVKTNAANAAVPMFDHNDFVSDHSPCPAEAVRGNLEFSVQCMSVGGTGYDNFGEYVIPENARSNMHKVVTGTVSLFGSPIYE